MFNPSMQIHYNTKYNIKAIREGRLIQEVNTHNVICDTALYRLAYRGTPFWQYLRCGSGSGTPSSSDTALFTPLWNDANFTITQSSVSCGDDSITWEGNATIAANATYIGTITEVGVWGLIEDNDNRSTKMITHALLYDAEGNPISIKKDDLTILKVTVIVTMTLSTSSHWKIFDPCTNYQRLLDSITPEIAGTYAYVPKCVPFMLLTSNPAHEMWAYIYHGSWPSSSNSLDAAKSPFGLGTNMANKTSDESKTHANPRILSGSVRLETDATTYPVYFKYVAFMHACYADLTNENVFANYKIQNIGIGTGDGKTVDFANPLNYFVANSEKLYVNGTALVRGVDYTIDNAPNFDMLQELTPCADAKFTGASTISSSYRPLFRRTLKNYQSKPYSLSGDRVAGEYITKDAPLIIDMGEAVKLNTIRTPKRSSSDTTAITITLAYSSDGDTWTDITTYAVGADAVKFADTTARYWRVSATTDYYISNYSDAWDDPATNAFLGYVGNPKIHFKTAPAADAIITMDVMMDRPFKNQNFVIDMQGELSLSI